MSAATFEDHPTDPDKVIMRKACRPITANEMAQSVWKIIEDVANKYPEEEREELKAVMLGQLGMAMFNGPNKGRTK
jgi:hypothetical protein